MQPQRNFEALFALHPPVALDLLVQCLYWSHHSLIKQFSLAHNINSASLNLHGCILTRPPDRRIWE
jgi:hypothetical protein